MFVMPVGAPLGNPPGMKLKNRADRSLRLWSVNFGSRSTTLDHNGAGRCISRAAAVKKMEGKRRENSETFRLSPLRRAVAARRGSNWNHQRLGHNMGMNITLPPDVEKRVRERIARGDYDDSDSLVQEAVHRLIEEDEGDLASLRARLRQADAEIDRGEGLEFDEDTTKELARDIHERGMRRLAELQKSNPRG